MPVSPRLLRVHFPRLYKLLFYVQHSLQTCWGTSAFAWLLLMCAPSNLGLAPLSLPALAVSDLFMSSFLVFRLIWLYDLKAASQVCQWFLVLLGALTYISILHICFLSCDRYVAVVYPLRYMTIMTNRLIKWTLIVCWCAPTLSLLMVPMVYQKAWPCVIQVKLTGMCRFGPHQ